MRNNKLCLHLYIRLLFLIASIAGIILNQRIEWLEYFYFIVIISLFVYCGEFKKHLKLFLFAFIPIYLSFILLYIIILNKGIWDFVHLKVLKLILLTSVIQLTLTIPPEQLFSTFRKWGFKGDTLIILLGAFTVWADVSYRSEKIITARFARGFFGKRTLINKAKQLPFILVPLVVGILRTSIERADSWDQKNILQLVNKNIVAKSNYPLGLNSILVLASIGWLLLSIILE